MLVITFSSFLRRPVPSIYRTCLSKMSTTPSPVCPKFVSVEGGDIHSRSKRDGIRFRLVSFNILAQAYVKSSFFPHSPSPSLKWKARSQSILTVLKDLGGDFLCLQEVDEYDSFYKPNMESHGYSSIYIQRSGQKRDGCGIFYRQDSAELLVEERIDYNDLVNKIQDDPVSCVEKDNYTLDKEYKKDSIVKGTSEDRGDPDDPRVRLKRDCVGIMAAFKVNEPFCDVVIVANTHLYWDPEWADVKLAQAKYLLSRLDQFRKVVSDQYKCTPSVILAGDFNSVPGDKVYRYLVSGNNSVALVDCSDEPSIPLCSVYAHVRGNEPPFTNCTPDFTNTLDYIFFSPTDRIKPVSILQLPEENSPDVLGGLPNYYHPSDHLPIGAEFELTSD